MGNRMKLTKNLETARMNSETAKRTPFNTQGHKPRRDTCGALS